MITLGISWRINSSILLTVVRESNDNMTGIKARTIYDTHQRENVSLNATFYADDDHLRLLYKALMINEKLPNIISSNSITANIIKYTLHGT